MIYSGSSKAEVRGSGTQLVKTSSFNSLSGDAIYVGYWFADGQLHGKTYPSTIYTEVNNFYKNNLANYDRYIDKNAGFCNDRTLSNESPGPGYGANFSNFGPRDRTDRLKPILTCPVEDDLFTTATGKTNGKGNGVLENPIGLITVDEAMFAGLVFVDYGYTQYNYLYTNKSYWTMSPSNTYWTGSGFNAVVLDIFETGCLNLPNANAGNRGIRPVINLKKDITFSKGNGLSTNPFEI